VAGGGTRVVLEDGRRGKEKEKERSTKSASYILDEKIENLASILSIF